MARKNFTAVGVLVEIDTSGKDTGKEKEERLKNSGRFYIAPNGVKFLKKNGKCHGLRPRYRLDLNTLRSIQA